MTQKLTESDFGNEEDLYKIKPDDKSFYNITEIFEMGKMASMYFNKTGIVSNFFFEKF